MSFISFESLEDWPNSEDSLDSSPFNFLMEEFAEEIQHKRPLVSSPTANPIKKQRIIHDITGDDDNEDEDVAIIKKPSKASTPYHDFDKLSSNLKKHFTRLKQIDNHRLLNIYVTLNKHRVDKMIVKKLQEMRNDKQWLITVLDEKSHELANSRGFNRVHFIAICDLKRQESIHTGDKTRIDCSLDKLTSDYKDKRIVNLTRDFKLTHSLFNEFNGMLDEFQDVSKKYFSQECSQFPLIRAIFNKNGVENVYGMATPPGMPAQDIWLKPVDRRQGAREGNKGIYKVAQTCRKIIERTGKESGESYRKLLNLAAELIALSPTFSPFEGLLTSISKGMSEGSAVVYSIMKVIRDDMELTKGIILDEERNEAIAQKSRLIEATYNEFLTQCRLYILAKSTENNPIVLYSIVNDLTKVGLVGTTSEDILIQHAEKYAAFAIFGTEKSKIEKSTEFAKRVKDMMGDESTEFAKKIVEEWGTVDENFLDFDPVGGIEVL